VIETGLFHTYLQCFTAQSISRFAVIRVIAALHANVLAIVFRIHVPSDAPRTGDPRKMFFYPFNHLPGDYPVGRIGQKFHFGCHRYTIHNLDEY
jgi:hypothetical protein